MARKESAGLLQFRRRGGNLEFLLAHPGGPYWSGRHKGAWTIPKGGIDPGEMPIDAAIREYREETGFDPCGPYLELGTITQRSGKVVHAWAFEGDCDPEAFVSINTTTEWPAKSGRQIEIPEVDRVAFYDYDAACEAINVAQVEFLRRLVGKLREGRGQGAEGRGKGRRRG